MYDGLIINEVVSYNIVRFYEPNFISQESFEQAEVFHFRKTMTATYVHHTKSLGKQNAVNSGSIPFNFHHNHRHFL